MDVIILQLVYWYFICCMGEFTTFLEKSM